MKTVIHVNDYDAYIEDWLKMRMRTFHQPSGVEGNRRDVKLFSKYLHEHTISHITGEVILEFISWLRETRKNGPGAINRKISSIRSYIRHLQLRQVDGSEGFPIAYVPRALHPYYGPPQVLEPEEVKRILNCIDKRSVLGFRDFLLYSMLYRLGLRLGEALGLDMQDIDLQNQLLTIHGKGRRQRKLPLVSDLPYLLEKWLYLRNKLWNAKNNRALFISKKGNRLSARTAQDNFQKIITRSQPLSLKKLTPHSLRHAFASHAIEGNADLLVLKAVLGHALMQTTEIYLHPSMKVLRKAVNDHLASEILRDLIDENIVVLRIQSQRTQRVA